MPHMHPRNTHPQRQAHPSHPVHQADAGAVRQCRSAPAADAGQRQLADLARRSGGANAHGLPQRLQQGIERLSGLAMDHVQVHRDSPEPARMQALAFAQGHHIHLAPGQEQHLAHEAWHVVQQAQGRVSGSARQGYGAPVNDDPALEQEAETMGQAALTGGDGAAPVVQRAAAPGGPAVVQRVGGAKLAIALDPALTPEDPLLPELVTVFDGYRQEIREGKAKAKGRFKGREAEIDEQTKYTQALQSAEMDYAELVKRLVDTKLFRVNGSGVIRRKAKVEGAEGQTAVVGRILQGEQAYSKTAEKSDAIVHDLYRKFDPTTKSRLKDKTEYIQVQGRMLRRYAYRGITPLEIEQIDKGGQVEPLFHDETSRAQAQSGMHFKGGFGQRRKAIPEKLDLSYLRGFSKVTSVTPAMYGFVHGRKGVGKFFSLRSTPGDITSNHGASFSDFGEVRIDLAMVPESDFVFHYAAGGSEALESGVPETDITDKETHTKEVQRARESVLRNREVILKAYPAAAVSWVRKHNIQESDVRTRGYNDGFNAQPRPDFVLYANAYDQGHAAGLADRQAYFLGQGHGREDWYGGYRFSPEPTMRSNHWYMQGYKSGYRKA